MSTRAPAVAGQFYPAARDACERALAECADHALPAVALPKQVIGGIVPHAGWMCSGAIAAGVIGAIAKTRQPPTIVVFGAVHVRAGSYAAVYPAGAWETPLGNIEIDADLARRLCAADARIRTDPLVHAAEHSIEVEVPFIQHFIPGAKLLPIMIPPRADAHEIGHIVGGVCRDGDDDVVFLASTDMTHYGPSYGFTPQGVGAAALDWATNVNDRRMIDLMLGLRADGAVAEAASHHNACGPGAIAATLAACRAYDAASGMLLEHTNSFEVLRKRFGEEPNDAVGYAGVVI